MCVRFVDRAIDVDLSMQCSGTRMQPGNACFCRGLCALCCSSLCAFHSSLHSSRTRSRNRRPVLMSSRVARPAAARKGQSVRLRSRSVHRISSDCFQFVYRLLGVCCDLHNSGSEEENQTTEEEGEREGECAGVQGRRGRVQRRVSVSGDERCVFNKYETLLRGTAEREGGRGV